MTTHTEYKYNCEPCKYKTNVRQYYYAHNKTKKHYRKTQMQPLKKKIKDDHWKCPQCKYEFNHRSSYYRHKHNNKCGETNITNIETQNINHITNIDNTTINNNTINITFSINSVEEAEKIKSILTHDKIIEICEPERKGKSLQSYDIVKKIQDLSIETKKGNKELQNFQKTNFRNDIIQVLEKGIFKTIKFKEYNREDLHKFAKYLMEKCEDIEPDKSSEEKLDLICEVLKEYDYYRDLDDKYSNRTIKYIITAIDECEKLSKLHHYNITKNRL